MPVAGLLDELVARHTLARGGADAIEAMHSLLIEVRIVEPGFTADAIYRGWP